MSRADEDSNKLDSLFSTNDKTDADDDFFSSLSGSSSGSSSDASSDSASDPLTTNPANAADASADLEPDSGDLLFGSGFDGENVGADFGSTGENVGLDDDPLTSDPSVDAAVGLGKKDRKNKKTKKTRPAKGERERVRYGSPVPFYLLGAIFLLLIVAGNIAAFAFAGAGSIGFLCFFDFFGLILMSVPALLLWQQTRQRVGLFDVAIGLVAAFLAIGCMALLTYQAKAHGWPSKVASAVVRTVDRV